MRREDYTIGWICALSHELTASRAMLDKIDPQFEDQDPQDHNIYSFGEIGGHKAVLACLPAGRYGTDSAATVARDMLRTFPSIKFGLMVGIGGGVPSEKNDIRLGDVVVSMPTEHHGGVINYEMGKLLPGGGFVQKSHLNKPPEVLLNAVSNLRSTHEMEESKIAHYIQEMLQKHPKLERKYSFPGRENDELFENECEHVHSVGTCSTCGEPRLVQRKDRVDHRGDPNLAPEVHYGLIGSGQKVVASVEDRKNLCKSDEVLCFEMEAAGLMDDFPCLVIRGISDYADSYKRHEWQPYAAAAAAAYAKELLGTIPRSKVGSMEDVSQVAGMSFSGPNTGIQMGQSFGNVAAVTGGLTINYATAARLDYSGQYSRSSLRPVTSYVDRPQLQVQLKKLLHDAIDQTPQAKSIVAVYGLGGTGKSQLLLRYLEQYRQDYAATFWIDASSTESIKRDFVHIHRLLYSENNPLGLGDVSAEDAVISVKNWFPTREGTWLFVFDNADNIEHDKSAYWVDIAQFMPDSTSVQVVINSRSTTVVKISTNNPVFVENMTSEEATDLLVKSAGFKSPDQISVAEDIVKELEFLPLAVNLAGDYIRESPKLFADPRAYLKEYQARRKVLLDQQPEPHIHAYYRSVLTTWETSFEAVERRNPQAARFLILLAFFNSKDIYLQLFKHELGAGNHSSEQIAPADKLSWQAQISPQEAIDEYSVEDYMRLLARFSFVKWSEELESYSMHKLVHAWGYDRLDIDSQKRYSASAMEITYQAIIDELPTATNLERPSTPNATEAPRNHEDVIEFLKREASGEDYICEKRKGLRENLRLVPHVTANFQSFRKAFDNSAAFTPEMIRKIWKLADFLKDMGCYADLHLMRKFQLDLCIQMLGDKHPATERTRHNFASSLQILGHSDEALKIFQAVAEREKSAFGEQHPSTFLTMNNIALCLSNMDRQQEACLVYQDVLRSEREVLSDDDSCTLLTMYNLAVTLDEIGKHEEALKLHKQCLDKRRTVLGPDHRDTIHSLCSLAVAMESQGLYQEALAMGKTVVENRRNILGDTHPDTVTAMGNLGGYMREMGRHQEAINIYKQVCKAKRNIYGSQHPETLSALHNLAFASQSAGNEAEAVALYEEILTTYEALGLSESLRYASSLSSFAIVLGNQGRYTKSEELQRIVLRIRKNVFPSDHRLVLYARHNLASIFEAQGKFKESIVEHRAVLDQMRRISGEAHPDTLMTLHNLAICLDRDGSYDEAVQMHEEVLRGRAKVFGEDHEDTLAAAGSLASTLQHQGHVEKGLSLQEELLARCNLLLGPKHRRTLLIKGNLAATLNKLSRYVESSALTMEILDHHRSQLGGDDPRTLSSMHHAAFGLYMLKNFEEAAALQQSAVTGRRRILGCEHPDTIQSQAILARMLFTLGRYRETCELEREVLVRRTHILGESHPDTFRAMKELIPTLFQLKEVEEAAGLQRQLFDIHVRSKGCDNADSISAAQDLAIMLWKDNRSMEAESFERAQIEALSKSLGPDDPLTLAARRTLAENLRKYKNDAAED